MYTITELAKLSGVSTRTLRYYDETGLLHPSKVAKNGYRFYDTQKIDELQAILFYKQMGLSLAHIKELIKQPDYDALKVLISHKENLLKQKKQLNDMLHILDQTINYYKGENNMKNEDKFNLFKQQAMEQNEEKYGKELRKTYGEDVIEASNDNFSNLSENEFTDATKSEEILFKSLIEIEQLEEFELTSELSNIVYNAHKHWLSTMSGMYSKEYHRQMVDLYLQDTRFEDYYTKHITRNNLKTLAKIVNYHTRD